MMQARAVPRRRAGDLAAAPAANMLHSPDVMSAAGPSWSKRRRVRRAALTRSAQLGDWRRIGLLPRRRLLRVKLYPVINVRQAQRAADRRDGNTGLQPVRNAIGPGAIGLPGVVLDLRLVLRNEHVVGQRRVPVMVTVKLFATVERLGGQRQH